VWRIADSAEDETIVRMCLALNAEDPGHDPVPAENTRRTLLALREAPLRGLAILLECDGRPCGYALLISFWSNELGGEVCSIDELYVAPEQRGRGYATRLIGDLAAGSAPWAREAVALTLEVTPANARARRLYERLGFRARNLAMRRRIAR
jgi:ribosomal protein S18 acetylase RimI-like enzyme